MLSYKGIELWTVELALSAVLFICGDHGTKAGFSNLFLMQPGEFNWLNGSVIIFFGTKGGILMP